MILWQEKKTLCKLDILMWDCLEVEMCHELISISFREGDVTIMTIPWSHEYFPNTSSFPAAVASNLFKLWWMYFLKYIPTSYSCFAISLYLFVSLSLSRVHACVRVWCIWICKHTQHNVLIIILYFLLALSSLHNNTNYIINIRR